MSDDDQVEARDAARDRAELALEVGLWLTVLVGTVGAWWLPAVRCLGSAGTAFVLLLAWSDAFTPVRARAARAVRTMLAAGRRVPGVVRARVSSARSGWATMIGRAT